MKVAALLFVMGRSEAKERDREESESREKCLSIIHPLEFDSGMAVNFKRLG